VVHTPFGAQFPAQLAAPAPVWERDVDVVVLGSGAAGLAAALAARPVRDVLLVTKGTLAAGSTQWAQGGLAAVLDPTDSLDAHVADTLAAGAGLCNERAVRELVNEAPTAIRYLMKLGAAFDPDSDGSPALTREGGHSHRRIVHAGGDQSGAEVQRTLDQSAMDAGVEVMEHAFALDLLIGFETTGERRAVGVRVARLNPDGSVRDVGHVTARAVVVATGGLGQVFASTSNPPAVTGDGLALAIRAGVAVTDMEFIQFHPTVLWQGAEAKGQLALISEAVRGEGAILIDGAGQRVMEGAHPLGDLAPRDVVAAAISQRMAEAPGGIDDHVFLDATAMGEEFESRFPSITASCRSFGIEPSRDPIPVAPAAHYFCGGIVADLDGITSLPGLFAVGEVACTGVHGANRLASNSLTEGVVAGTRVGRALSWMLAEKCPPVEIHGAALLDGGSRAILRSTMSRNVGVLRRPEGLAAAREVIDDLAANTNVDVVPSIESFEATNLLTVAAAVVGAAEIRTESRGCHRRTDCPEPRDEWRRHVSIHCEDGEMRFEA
jgi:L-aspartate oxidase